jgi:ParB/Sulfiredoxin domain
MSTNEVAAGANGGASENAVQAAKLNTSDNIEATALAQVPATRVEPIPLAHIKDGGAQIRVEMRPETINDYANEMLDGAVFPPIVVFHDGCDFWLADGFHRVGAARKIGHETIVAEIREGSSRDAVLHGVGSNAAHGLRRTQADKRRAVERLLTDPEWARWSDRKIAEAAKVDHKTVGTIRRELAGEFPNTKAAKVKSGEFPTANGTPNNRASLLGDVLPTIPDDVLVAECRRRGLTVEAANA